MLIIDTFVTLPWDTVLHTIPPKPIAGADAGINTLVGWVLKILSLLSFIGLLVVFSVGYESYRHNQAQDFMQKAKAWVAAALVGANADRIVTIFFPGFKLTAKATSIPGMDTQVEGIIGNIIWILGWVAFACLIFLAIKGFVAFRENGIGEFVSKFYWFIVASLGISFAAQIAGTFFPSALDYK
ncbi:hypothetical protein [Plantibacter sp. CFBP 8804]|uniref:hypothetical protein n=1 Tax=Plantibacter sp. CFBP 8804 TaxID=2775270 RepID=UPI0017842186|nr:hypothetical protein [Plantibacter sp. CFBP 8804]MBD8519144.1 hypothetical protein [Plantibacter sp. CFBP 8804]